VVIIAAIALIATIGLTGGVAAGTGVVIVMTTIAVPIIRIIVAVMAAAIITGDEAAVGRHIWSRI